MGNETKENLPLQATNLAGMIAVQEGSVVSRTLINEKAGTVTLFAFDAGQGLSEHTAPYDALVYLLEGDLDLTIAGNPYHLRAGEMIIMPANQPHGLKAASKIKMLLIMIRSQDKETP